MRVGEQIDAFTSWLARCEKSSHENGLGHKHLEWSLEAWTRQALALVVPVE